MRSDVWFAAATVQHVPLLGFRPESREPSIMHRELPGFAATLYRCPALADTLGVGRVFVKDESQRLDLSSFKIPGALSGERIVSGESGAASLAGMLALTRTANGRVTSRLGLHPDPSILLINTEGATNPGSYARITGRSPQAVAGHRTLRSNEGR